MTGNSAWGPVPQTRRNMLSRSALGFGTLALTQLLLDEGLLASESGGVLTPAATATAKRVIFLFMGGGPSQVDTFDPKPELERLNGQDVPESIASDVPKIARSPLNNLMASPFKFTRHGASGIPVSSLYPEIARCVDDLCILRNLRHDSPIHAPAEFIATTGTGIGDRPSLGSWLYYGLGSENNNLPGFMIFKMGDTIRPPTIGSGFLPARFQGTLLDAEKGIPNLQLPQGVTATQRQRQLSMLRTLNHRHLERNGESSELEARIRAYELSFRMQMTAPEAFDLGSETAETQSLYGLDRKETAEFGKYCLWARRLAERGVRFIQLRSGGWDAHSDLKENHTKQCLATDRPIAGLLQDLKRRGLLDETLIVWGGEFGRTPTMQGGSNGRDHSPSGYTMWLAGGGVKGGQIVGATDAVGYATIGPAIHPNDLHATLLHALGIDQHALYYTHQNRKELVTVNGGNVVHEALN